MVDVAPLASGHYANPAPFDPHVSKALTAAEERFYRASSLKLIWWKFRQNRIAVVAAAFLLLLYLSLPFVEVLAPYPLTQRHGDFIYAPPQRVHLFHDGSFAGPIVYPYTFKFDLDRFQRTYVVDRTKPQALRFLCRGEPYRYWGGATLNFHI